MVSGNEREESFLCDAWSRGLGFRGVPVHLPPCEHHAPQMLDQALRMKRDPRNSSAIPAGGTDLVVNLNNHLLPPEPRPRCYSISTNYRAPT